jgi:hypothetical protein
MKLERGILKFEGKGVRIFQRGKVFNFFLKRGDGGIARDHYQCVTFSKGPLLRKKGGFYEDDP